MDISSFVPDYFPSPVSVQEDKIISHTGGPLYKSYGQGTKKSVFRTLKLMFRAGDETEEQTNIKIAAKLEEIRKVDPKAAQRFQAAIITLKEKIGGDPRVLSKYITTLIEDISYEKRNGKTCLRIKGIFQKAISCEDPTPEDFTQKLGITPKRGAGYWEGSDFHTNPAYAKTKYYDYKQSWLAKADQKKKDAYMITPAHINSLISATTPWSGLDNHYMGAILSQLMNTGMPGVRNPAGTPAALDKSCDIWSSKKEYFGNARALVFGKDGNGDLYRGTADQNFGRIVRFFED